METGQNIEQTELVLPKKKKNGKFWIGLIVGIVVSLVLMIGLCVALLGYRLFVISKSRQQGESGAFYKNRQAKLQTIEQIVNTYYYEGEIDSDKLWEGAYKGMMTAIGDPYSTYYTASELTELMEQTEGIYYGIGAYVGLDTVTTLPKIVSAIPGTPAEAADLRPDDIIYKVNGEEIYGLDLSAVTALIKGEEGTTVELTIIRDGENDYLIKEVERRRVETPTVTYEMFDDGMAYIQIGAFEEVTISQFADALATVKGSDMKGLILDLRANPGGSLDSVLEIAEMLLPEGLIVYMEDRYGTRKEYKCDGKNQFTQPMVVLVDGNSASAAEVLAGALQDYEVGTLVGTTTFGKGIVQQVITLADQSAVKITISGYYTPKGRNIHGIGIEPDIECEFDGEAYYSDNYDNQLEFAKEVLSDMIGKK